MKLVSKKKHAIIRISKLVLNLASDVSEEHVNQVKEIFQNHIKDGMSPNDIKKYYGIEYSDFGMFIKKCLGLSILSCKEAVNNYNLKAGKIITEEKRIYYKKCHFQFDPYSIPGISGYEKLLSLGMYHATMNPTGVCRDHIMSVAYGWRNKVPPELISHPSNCQFLTHSENSKKNDKSYITVDELKNRVINNILTPVNNNGRCLTKSAEHKHKISESNKKYMNVTNGVYNIRMLKSQPIPPGYKRGLTRRK